MAKFLVTGGLGFIGSAFVRKALELGFSIVNLDAITYAANLDNLDKYDRHKDYDFEAVDLIDHPNLDEIFDKYQPDGVVHFAAESHVDNSIDRPSKFIQTNVLGTFNLLEASRRYWDKRGKPDHFRLLHVSTDEVFGSLKLASQGKFTEETRYDPRSPYSASKASSDHLVNAWRHTYGLPTIVTNCSNNYGPFQFTEKLIPRVIVNALSGRTIPVYGDGSNVRDWLYVDDHVNALLCLLRSNLKYNKYNIGGNSEISNIKLVKHLCEIMEEITAVEHGSYSNLIKFVADRPGHDLRYAISYERITNELGWQPSLGLLEGLQITVRWYLDNKAWWQPMVEEG